MTAVEETGEHAVSSGAVQLRLAAESDIPWAGFDAEWYLTAYPSVRDRVPDTSPESLLYFYLEFGRRLGHSPNLFFDEGWYVRNHPDVAADLERGSAVCGFHDYCRGGYRHRSPHWLFDESLYRRNYPGLTDASLSEAGLANGYDHYLRHGAREGRIGHFLFDPAFYRGQLTADQAAEVEAVGPFRHYLERLAAGRPEVPTSRYFDPTWYFAKYPEIADAVAELRWHGALHHYLGNDTPTAFDPLPQFSEAYYLGRHAEAAGAVARGEHRNGYAHFLAEGRFKPLSPSGGIDLGYYRSRAAVEDELRKGRAPDAFTHYLAIGRVAGLPAVPPAEDRLTEAQANGLFHRKARDLLPLFGRAPLSFACSGAPELSVVLAARNDGATILASLASLRHAHPGEIELVIVDAGSEDDTRQIEQFVRGARILRFDRDIGGIAARNTGLHIAAAEAVLFLDGAVELAPGAVAAALRRLRSDPTIGAVGGKAIRGDGVLREAGNMIEPDGSLAARQTGASPLCPEANFVRDVDFCSSAFLLARAELLRGLDGFDAAFRTLRYADADLGVRIAAAGYRNVYDPAVAIYDYRGEEAEDALRADREMFARKHAGAAPLARPVRRLLFIETAVQRLTGSGFVRSNDILRAMAALGWQVTVFPLRRGPFDLAAIYADMPDSAEIMHDRGIADLPAFLAERGGQYEVIWVGRTHNLDSIAEILRDAFAGGERRPRIVLDTEAIAALRDAARAALPEFSEPFDRDAALAREFANASLCDRVVAVSAEEADCLESLGFGDVAVLGHSREIRSTPRPFQDRGGMLFVGAIHEAASPNYDSLCWFADRVLPLVEEALGWETRLTIAGYVGENVDMGRFRGHPRITLRGMIAELEPLYDAHRLFVAPTRFAAGIPYKVYEAASYGLPVVASELLRRQTGWKDGSELLAADIADPALFAERIVTLYRDETLWRNLRENALARLRAENSPERYAEAIAAILAGEAAPASPGLDADLAASKPEPTVD